MMLELVNIKYLFLAFIFFFPLKSYSSDLPKDPAWFIEILSQYSQQFNFPALGASVVLDGKVVATSVVGVRKHGDKTSAEQHDRFHIGSIAKPITVTMLARYIELGFFNWNDTVEKMFPKLVKQAHPDYRKVTIEQLLSHTSGMPYQPTTPESKTDVHGTNTQLNRREYVKAALKDNPEAKPGTKYIYGGGQMLVAHYAENLMGMSYEQLIKDEVFKPLKMETARFGPPATPNKIDAPWEHVIENGKIKPIAPDQKEFYQARSPAGRNLVVSLTDLGKLVAEHLKGARGKSSYLKTETFKYLHSPVPVSDHGVSWAIYNGGITLGHSGSTLKNLSYCRIEIKENFAFCVATNIWYKGIDEKFYQVVNRVSELIRGGRFNDL